ncbi:MAG: diguanylate cyclase, partial [Desulfobacteraceae bacterium]
MALGSVFIGGDSAKVIEDILTVIEFDKIQTIEAINDRFLNVLAHDMEEALAQCQKAHSLSQAIGYKKGVLDAESNRAWYHILKCEFDHAFPLLKDLPEKYELIGDTYGHLLSINSMGVLHLDMGNYDHALPYFFKSVNLARNAGEKEREASSLANIGLIYNEMGKIEEAFDYFNEALNIPERNDTCFYTASKCIGLYYIDSGEYESALGHLENARKIAHEKRDTHFESELLTTLGCLYRAQKQYETAGDLFQQSLEISQTLGNIKIETENLYEIGCLHLARAQIESALSCLTRALDLALDKDIGNIRCKCYEQLSSTYEQKKEFEKALSYLKKFNAAEKEYNLNKAELRLKSLGFEHEIEKKHQMAEIYRLKNIELEEANRRITDLANHDTLTGLPNRRLLMEHLKTAIYSAKRNHLAVALLFIDLDDFKPVNDRLGHRAGDLVLKQVGDRLAQTMRRTDVVARFGGDEFVIMVPSLEDTGYVLRIIEKINHMFEKEFVTGSHRFKLGASIG